MLPVYLNASTLLIAKASYNVYLITDMFLDFCKGLDYETFLEEIFPPFCIRRDIDKCKKIMFDLKDMAVDEYKRDCIPPIYEYALYMLLEWWLDASDSELETDLSNCKITNEDDQYLADNIDDIEQYKDFMFDDWDFLDIPNFISIYKSNLLVYTAFFDVNLDDYIDLMPDDIRDEYETIKRNRSIEHSNTEACCSDEEFIIKRIYSALIRMEKRPISLISLSETGLSDELSDRLHPLFMDRGLILDREEPGGFSLVNTGMLDFYIYKYYDNCLKTVAIGENKEWGGFEDSLKQVIGYMDNNTAFGFTIVFNKNTDLNTVLANRMKFLTRFNVNGDFCVIGDVQEIPGLTNVLVSKHENPEHRGTYFTLYHSIANAYKPERKEAAKQARQRKHKVDVATPS